MEYDFEMVRKCFGAIGTIIGHSRNHGSKRYDEVTVL